MCVLGVHAPRVRLVQGITMDMNVSIDAGSASSNENIRNEHFTFCNLLRSHPSHNFISIRFQ